METYTAILPTTNDNGNSSHKPDEDTSEASSNPLIRATLGIALGLGAEVGLLKQEASARDSKAIAKLVCKLLDNSNGRTVLDAAATMAAAPPPPLAKPAISTPTPSKTGSNRNPRACFKCRSFSHLAAQCLHHANPE